MRTFWVFALACSLTVRAEPILHVQNLVKEFNRAMTRAEQLVEESMTDKSLIESTVQRIYDEIVSLAAIGEVELTRHVQHWAIEPKIQSIIPFASWSKPLFHRNSNEYSRALHSKVTNGLLRVFMAKLKKIVIEEFVGAGYQAFVPGESRDGLSFYIHLSWRQQQ